VAPVNFNIAALPNAAHAKSDAPKNDVVEIFRQRVVSAEARKNDPLALQIKALEESAADVLTRSHLRQWVRGPLRELLPHQHALLAFGRSHSLGIKLHDFVAVDLPETYLSAIQDAPDLMDSPVLARWFALREPIRISADTMLLQHGTKWVNNFQSHGMRDVIVDGHIAHKAGSVTLLKLYNCSPQVTALLYNVRESLLAALNAIWERILSAEALTRTDKLRIIETLSPVEKEVLHWIKQGKTNFEIATIMIKSPHTIKKHLEHIYGKTGTCNRHALALLAIER
jgi:LuxR family transcriptional regulator, quorum-sensing system regulator CviR